MKKYLCLIGVLLFIFLFGTSNVYAAGEARGYVACSRNYAFEIKCDVVLEVTKDNVKIDHIYVDIPFNAEMKNYKYSTLSTPISFQNNWTTLGNVGTNQSTFYLYNGNNVWNRGRYTIASFAFESVTGNANSSDCGASITVSVNNTCPKCTVRSLNGTLYYYDGSGNSSTDPTNYYKDCFKSCSYDQLTRTYRGINGQPVGELEYYRQCPIPCKKVTVGNTTEWYGPNKEKLTSQEEYDRLCSTPKICYEDTVNGKYYGITGEELFDDANKKAVFKYYEQCYNLSCRAVAEYNDNNEIVSIRMYGRDGIETDQLSFLKQCYKNSCQVLEVEDTYHYFDANGNELNSEDEYFKQCFRCDYYSNTREDVYQSYEDIILDILNGESVDKDYAMFKPVYQGYIDNNGKKLDNDRNAYLKSCATFSCQVLPDGTYYDKDGNIVSEDEFLKSCYKCRKEDGKFYDENGKETTESNWKVMCEPHKCQYLGGKYFNDKGAIVTKAEYEKACTNPKTGDKETVRMYIYIFGGFALTAAIVLGSKKFAKVNKIK